MSSDRKWIALALGMTLVGSLCSCLREIENTYNPGVSPAVVRQHGDSAFMMALTRFGWIYGERFSSYSEGKCLLVSFDYDPASPENAGAEERGYYRVEVQADQAVDQWTATSPLTPTDRLLTYEQPVPLAVNPYDTLYYTLLDNYLFLPSICQTTAGRELSWQLTYDSLQQPRNEKGRDVYALFLRAVATTPPPEEQGDTLVAALNAFDLSRFREAARRVNGEGEAYIRLYYVNSIDPADSSRFTWGATEPLPIN